MKNLRISLFSFLALILFTTALCANADEKQLMSTVDKIIDTVPNIMVDAGQRFCKCGGELAQMAARGEVIELFRVPYPKLANQLSTFRDGSLALYKRYEKEKKLDFGADSVQWQLRRLVWRSQVLRPILRDLSKQSRQPKQYAEVMVLLRQFESEASTVLKLELGSPEEQARSSWIEMVASLVKIPEMVDPLLQQNLSAKTRTHLLTAKEKSKLIIDELKEEGQLIEDWKDKIDDDLLKAVFSVHQELEMAQAELSELAIDSYGHVKEFDQFSGPLGTSGYLFSARTILSVYQTKK
jgi:hypothetical protein